MLVCELLDDLEPSEIPFYRVTHSVKMESENWTSPSRTKTVQRTPLPKKATSCFVIGWMIRSLAGDSTIPPKSHIFSHENK